MVLRLHNNWSMRTPFNNGFQVQMHDKAPYPGHQDKLAIYCDPFNIP